VQFVPLGDQPGPLFTRVKGAVGGPAEYVYVVLGSHPQAL
jgi:hypothetical protein